MHVSGVLRAGLVWVPSIQNNKKYYKGADSGMRRLNPTEYFFPMGCPSPFCTCEPVLTSRALCSRGRRNSSEVNVNTHLHVYFGKASASHLMGVGQELSEGKVVPSSCGGRFITLQELRAWPQVCVQLPAFLTGLLTSGFTSVN